jgi:DNA-binding MarR family transcriptional regulator
VTKPAALDDVELAASLRLSVTRLARRLRQQDQTGFGPTLTAALASVARHGSPTHGELAALEGLSAPTITAVVDKLVGLGLVRREVDPNDRRVARVHVTDAGSAQLEAVRERRTEWLDAQLRELSDDDRERLRAAADVLRRLAEGPR